jgi:hypothetical protein
MIGMRHEAARNQLFYHPYKDQEKREGSAIELQAAQLEILPQLRGLSKHLFSSKKYIHNNHPGPRFDDPAKDGFYLNPWDMNAGNLLIGCPEKPSVTAWLDWENVPTDPVWDIRYSVMSRILGSISKYDSSSDEWPDDEDTSEDSEEETTEMKIAKQLYDEMRPKDKMKRIPGERHLNIQKGKLLVGLAWINFDVEKAEDFIDLMTKFWEGRIWVKDVQDPDDWQGRRRGSRCTKHQSEERWL